MYDVTVIGNDLSSLIAAITTSRLGLETALILDEPQPHLLRYDNYTFPLYPFPVLCFGTSQTIGRFFSELGIELPPCLVAESINPGCQIISPNHRFDLTSDRIAITREMAREFPSLKNKEYLHEIFSNGFSSMQRLMEQENLIQLNSKTAFPSYKAALISFLKWSPHAAGASRFVNSEAGLLRLAESIMLLSSNLDIKNISGIAQAYAFSLVLRGFYYLHGSHGAFMNELTKLFAARGELIDNCSVMRIKPRKDIVLDIKKDNVSANIKTKKLIVSSKWEKLNLLLLSHKPFIPTSKRLKGIKVSHYPFTLQLGINGKCIPDITAPYAVIISDEDKSIMDNNCLLLEISKKEDASRAPLGRRAMSATSFTNISPWLINNSDLTNIALNMIRILEGTFPFLRNNIDILNLEQSMAFSRSYQEMIHQRYDMSNNSYFGLGILPHKTPARNVFITGGMLMAGLGYDGEIRSGIHAANLAIAGEDISREFDKV